MFASVFNAIASAPTALSNHTSAPIVIALGQIEAQVIAGKGQPTNKVISPNKTISFTLI